jgi:hypothetical protein
MRHDFGAQRLMPHVLVSRLSLAPDRREDLELVSYEGKVPTTGKRPRFKLSAEQGETLATLLEIPHRRHQALDLPQRQLESRAQHQDGLNSLNQLARWAQWSGSIPALRPQFIGSGSPASTLIEDSPKPKKVLLSQPKMATRSARVGEARGTC